VEKTSNITVALIEDRKEYAEQQSVAFADWLMSEGWCVTREKGVWAGALDVYETDPKTTKELYEMYLKEIATLKSELKKESK